MGEKKMRMKDERLGRGTSVENRRCREKREETRESECVTKVKVGQRVRRK